MEGEIIANTWIKFVNQVLDVFCSVDLGLLELPYKGLEATATSTFTVRTTGFGQKGQECPDCHHKHWTGRKEVCEGEKGSAIP